MGKSIGQLMILIFEFLITAFALKISLLDHAAEHTVYQDNSV